MRFLKKEKEPTTEDAPDSIAPWEMLEDPEIISLSAAVQATHPDRNLTAFARRIDQDTVAYFDKGADGLSKKVIVLQRRDASRSAREIQYKGFVAWFDEALVTSAAWEAKAADKS